MLLSLKRTSSGGLIQSWDVDENNGGVLESPISPRMVHGDAHFPNSVFRTKVGNAGPIPMEVIHIRDERCNI